MIRALFAFAPLALIGCVTPTSGTYLITTTSSESDCESSGDTGGGDAEDVTMGIRVAEDGSNFKTGDVTCPLDGVSFDCTLSESSTDYADTVPDADAVFTTSSTITGKWTSSSKIAGTSAFAFACTGADCETYMLPTCSGTSEFEGELQE
jgi:hypothetical protein